MIEKRDVMITPFKLERTMHIYLPDDYYETDERYPVLYMYDGHNLFFDEDATYGKCWGIKDFMDKWEKKLIIVGMECNHHGNDRLAEYCPYTIRSKSWRNIDGRGKEYMDWVVKELKPWVDKEYRTMPFRECTGIAGSSMGGLMSVYTIICYNDTFSKAACLSSAMEMCMARLRKEFETHYIDPNTRVYFGYGSLEPKTQYSLAYSTSCNLEFARRFVEAGASSYPYIQMEGHHCEADWERQLPIFMPYLWTMKY